MVRVLIFGDSLADGLQLEGMTCETVSRWGETTYGLLNGFPNLEHSLRTAAYDLVILIGGSNDMGSDSIPMFAIDNLMRMHHVCKRMKVSVSVGVTILHDEFNRQYVNRCRPMGIPVCNFLKEDMDTRFIADDGIHLNDEGKQYLSRELVRTIRKPYVGALLRDIFPNDSKLSQLIVSFMD